MGVASRRANGTRKTLRQGDTPPWLAARYRARMRACLAVLVLLIAPAGAAADPYMAPGKKVLWGGQGGYDARHISLFEQQSGKHPAVFNYFISWKASESSFHWLGFRLDDAERQGA